MLSEHDASTHAPLRIDADLSESSYLDAKSQLHPLKPIELIVSQANAVEAGRIAQARTVYAFTFIVMYATVSALKAALLMVLHR